MSDKGVLLSKQAVIRVYGDMDIRFHALQSPALDLNK
jgi:hypothetical protein